MINFNTSWKNLLDGTSYPVHGENFGILKIPSSETNFISLRSRSRSILEQFENLLFQGKEMPINHLQLLPSVSEDSATSSFDVSTSDPDGTSLKMIQADLQRKIYALEPDDQKKLQDLNAKRLREGKPPIDFQNTTREIEQIMNDASLSDKEKKNRIDAVRKRLGLGKKDMKKLFTKRLAKIYKQAADQIKSRLDLLKQAVQETEKIYGKDSPQAQAARERLVSAQQTLEPTLRDFQQKSGLYNSLYPSFWSKLGGFFKKIGKGFVTIGKVFFRIMNFVSPLLRFIPGIGQMISFGWGALKGIVQAIRGNWRGFLGASSPSESIYKSFS
jgi:hypothetical protein